MRRSQWKLLETAANAVHGSVTPAGGSDDNLRVRITPATGDAL